ncbi:hypothetical protein VPH35_116172 [Triticum aestivum]
MGRRRSDADAAETPRRALAMLSSKAIGSWRRHAHAGWRLLPPVKFPKRRGNKNQFFLELQTEIASCLPTLHPLDACPSHSRFRSFSGLQPEAEIDQLYIRPSGRHTPPNP